MSDVLGGEDSGVVAADAELGDVDLMAEHALAHIGLAALTGGDDAPARELEGGTLQFYR